MLTTYEQRLSFLPPSTTTTLPQLCAVFCVFQKESLRFGDISLQKKISYQLSGFFRLRMPIAPRSVINSQASLY